MKPFNLEEAMEVSTDSMEKKFELTEETRVHNGYTFHRIRALRDFRDVKKGDLGGWIAEEGNLSHYGNAWVYDNARVCGKAQVYDNALVYDNAQVYGDALVYDNAQVYGDALVYGNALVCGKALVYGKAQVCGKAQVYDNAWVCGDALVYGNALVCGDALVYGNALVCGNALVYGNYDYIVFKNWWSSGRYFTWTRSNNKWSVGCFFGTGQELIDKAYSDSEEKGREYERIVNYVQDILGVPHLMRTKNNPKQKTE